MSDRDEALALLRGRFPEPWRVVLAEPGTRASEFDVSWCVRASLGGDYDGVRVQGWALDSASAARACIAAWDEATRREVMPCNCAELPAERAHADRLAEALRGCCESVHKCGDRWKAWPKVLCSNCNLGDPVLDLLAAHTERRKA